MKKYIAVLLFFISPLYAQNPTPSPESRANTQTPINPSSNNPSSPVQTRPFTSIVENKDNLIQYYSDQMAIKQTDPYPLASYQGKLVTNIDEIKKQFQVKNIQLVKASLESWLLKDASNFPTEGYLLLGNVYDYLQLYDKAVETYDKGIALVTGETQIPFLLNKAQVLRHWAKNQESLEILKKIDPKYEKTYPQIFLYLGISSLYLSDKNSAILNLRKYLEYEPKSPQAEKVRRAIAWLVLNQSGSYGGGQGNGDAEAIHAQRQEMEKMLQNLVDSQLNSEENTVMNGTHSSVEDKSLDIKEKDINEGENNYNAIAD